MSIIQRVKQLLITQHDRVAVHPLRKNLLQALPFWIGAFITGLLAVMYARLFALAEHWSVYLYVHIGWLIFFLTPACFFLAWWLVNRYAPYARGSGIPQVMAAIELSGPGKQSLVNQLLGVHILIIKVCSSLIMSLGGGAVGREGPTIQISASVFSKINDWLPEWFPRVSRRNMLVTGAASGLAAAFNTPLGGIVFAIEELTKTHFTYFRSALLAGVIIAGLTALNLLGPYLYLGYPALQGIPVSIVLYVIPLALLAGMSGAYMGKMILWLFQLKKRLKAPFSTYLYPVMAGLITASIIFFISNKAMGSGKEIMVDTLFTSEKGVDWYLPLLRLFSPVVAFSNGAAGGIFAPSLSSGASIGALMAEYMHLTPPETNLAILCGMVACLTGITRSPFTSSILVIEMTNSHHIIFHLMLSALMANIMANVVTRRSFYDHLKEQYMEEVQQDVTGDHANKKDLGSTRSFQ